VTWVTGGAYHVDLWAEQITLTTGIPSGLTIPQLLNSIATGVLDATALISHRLTLDEIMSGYDTFTRSAETGGMHDPPGNWPLERTGEAAARWPHRTRTPPRRPMTMTSPTATTCR
jgi:hypothetical protein